MIEHPDIPRTGRGTVGGTGIVLSSPLDLPEGTEVVVSVRVVKAEESDRSAEETLGRMTPAELHGWALRNPEPQSWWDATDNPFLPADAPENQRRRPDDSVEER